MEREYTQKYRQIMKLKNKEVVFDASETPFFKVSPELSGLTDNLTVANELGSLYPDLNFSRACLADGNVLIQDLDTWEYYKKRNSNVLTDTVMQLNEASMVTLQVADAKIMTENLITLLRRDSQLNRDPLIILPGNGAETVKKYLVEREFIDMQSVISLPTKRTKLPSKKFSLSVDYSNIPQAVNPEKAIIFDDVVASGQTASMIGCELKKLYPYMECIVASWIMLRPTDSQNKASSSGIYGIDKTYTSIALKGNGVSRPPINSLSCFIDTENNDDYLQRKEEYKQKYISDATTFEVQLSRIRDKLVEKL